MATKVFLGMILFIFLGAGLPVYAAPDDETEDIPPDWTFQEEISVTANLEDTPMEEVASSVTIITREEIEKKKAVTVLELLRDVPGVDVVQNGGPGQVGSVMIRGANSEYTMVLIDGVRVNDPMSPGGGFDFGNLPVNNIERIEILRGPQSTLYGSDAMSGVINIVTRKGSEQTDAFFSLEGGSFSSIRGAAGASGGYEKMDFSLGLSYLDTKGISAASEDLDNSENDAFKNTSFSGNLNVAPVKALDFGINFFYINSDVDLDNFGGYFGDDPNSTGDTEMYTARPYLSLALLDNLWKQDFDFYYADTKRDYYNPEDDDHPFDFSESTYQGTTKEFNWKNTIPFHENNTLIAGLEYRHDEGESYYFSDGIYGPYEYVFEKQHTAIKSFYAQDVISYRKRFFGTLGIRYDDSDRFDGAFTYRLTGAVFPFNTTTKLKATVGSGFKIPTLFQLYSMFGNEHLVPQKNTGIDIGIEQSIEKARASIGITYFYNAFKDLIDFDPVTYTYLNIAEATTTGIEIYSYFVPSGSFTGRVWYTFTDAKDDTAGERLLRRPRHKFGISANYNYREKLNITPSVIYVGEREDMDYSIYPVARTTLRSYVLANLAASYDFVRYFQGYVKIDNLFDQQYEEVFGYGARGIGVYAGVTISK